MEPTTTSVPTQPKFVRWALLVGIVVTLNVFFNVLVSIALPEPRYEAYCPQTQVVKNYSTQEACVAAGGQWTEASPAKPFRVAPSAPAVSEPSGYCDIYYTCRTQFETAHDLHARDAFIAFTVLGTLALILGLLPIGSSIVSSGLSYGGVVALVVGSAQYWGIAGRWVRLAIITAGLLALLYVGWKRFRD